MTRLIRLLGTGVLVVVAIRILDYVLTPALPLLVTLFMLTLVAYVVLGRRSL